jgi:hypothetical protein
MDVGDPAVSALELSTEKQAHQLRSSEETSAVPCPPNGPQLREITNQARSTPCLRDRIAALIERGLSLDQVIASAPTLEYDVGAGPTPAHGTNATFVETIYRNLAR